MASNSEKNPPPSDEKPQSTEEKKCSKPEAASGSTPPPTIPGLNFDAFDFSNMAGIVNNPSIREMAEQIAKDPAFNQLAEQFQRPIPNASHEGGLPNFDPEHYLNTMQQVMHNPEFMKMAERLGSALVKDPQMSPFLDPFSNPETAEHLTERMARMKEDPEFKTILDEVNAGGPSAMMKYWNDPDVMKRIGEAMGIPITDFPDFPNHTASAEPEVVGV